MRLLFLDQKFSIAVLLQEIEYIPSLHKTVHDFPFLLLYFVYHRSGWAVACNVHLRGSQVPRIVSLGLGVAFVDKMDC